MTTWDLEEIRIFTLVARLGSFTEAAREANLSLSAVSKKVTRLERKLGARLLHRTTRSLHLTEAGSNFFTKCNHVLRTLQEAEADISLLSSAPRGLLKVNVPESFGRHCLIPALPDFLIRYPEITLEFTMNTRERKFDADEFDILVRRAQMLDDDIQCEIFLEGRSVVCATPTYLQRFGRPNSPKALVHHNCLIYKYPAVRNVWSFHYGKKTQSIKVAGNMAANNYDAIIECALNDIGIACVPSYIINARLASGQLIELFPGHLMPERPFTAIYPRGGYTPPKIRAFIDFFKQRFQSKPSLQPELGAWSERPQTRPRGERKIHRPDVEIAS